MRNIKIKVNSDGYVSSYEKFIGVQNENEATCLVFDLPESYKKDDSYQYVAFTLPDGTIKVRQMVDFVCIIDNEVTSQRGIILLTVIVKSVPDVLDIETGFIMSSQPISGYIKKTILEETGTNSIDKNVRIYLDEFDALLAEIRNANTNVENNLTKYTTIITKLTDDLNERIAKITDNASDMTEVIDARGNFTNLGLRLDKKPYYFDTIAEMKNADLKIGDMVITSGYYEPNDGGDGKYEIVDDNLIEDEGSIHALTNKLFAKLIANDNTINVKQFGAKGNGLDDATLAIQKCLDKYDNVFIPDGTYLISESLKVKENNKLVGESKINTIITTNSEIILIEPKDNYIKNIEIRNLKLSGNYKATSAICLYKTKNPDSAHIDTHIRLKNIYIHRCTNWCLMLGRNDDERALPNTVIDDLTIEQFTGGGIYLSSRCTDSMIQNVIVGGSNIATKPNIQVEGYNLHFNNCKSCVSGTSENAQDCWYFNGGAQITGEIEAQESTKYGVEINKTKYINLNINTDRCGDINSNYSGVYINDGGYINLNLVCTNISDSQALLSKSCIKINNSKNINMNIIKESSVPNVFDTTSPFNNSYSIKYNVNGEDESNVVPTFNTQSYNDNGITATTIDNNKILINGTATDDVTLLLKGGWGYHDILSFIPANSIVNVVINDNVQFQVFCNSSTVLASTTNQLIKTTSEDLNVTGIVLKIPKGTVINKVIEPKILIVSNV